MPLTRAPLSKNQIRQGLKAPAGTPQAAEASVLLSAGRSPRAFPVLFPVLKDADTVLASDPSAQEEPCSESFKKSARMREGRPAVTGVLSTDPTCSRCGEAPRTSVRLWPATARECSVFQIL